MKQVFNDTTLSCSLQENSQITTDNCLHGMLAKTAKGFRFEEEAKEESKPHTRNPKIYNGKIISLVRKEDNSIQFSFKTTKPDFDRENYPSMVSEEIKNAINMID